MSRWRWLGSCVFGENGLGDLTYFWFLFNVITDYQNNSKVSENEWKNDSTSNVDEQINNSTTNDEDKNSGMGFFKDPILGELTCQTCQYQCYGSTKMLKHIKTNHLVISNFESSSRNPEGKNEGIKVIWKINKYFISH